MLMPEITIYNTLTRKKEIFVPQNPPEVKMYTCGVTVYDECHVGHARSLYVFDVMKRYLKYRGFDVKLVRNITDIDDKIINRAHELKIGWEELVDTYIVRYREDLETLGIEKIEVEPRATENISEMIDYIKDLINKSYAYVTDTGVYFSVRKFVKYGQLSNQSIEQMLIGVRKGADETKEDPLDFALWKRSKENEPSWDSPWGKGRPGWHIECSVMSQKYLKTDTLDIHAGGMDLVFPHHENEIAQAQSLTAKPFANYWIHHGLLTINGQKMAKSLGNFVTIKDFVTHYRDIEILKLFFLSTHYAHPIDYNIDKVEEVRKQKRIFDHFFNKVGILSEGESRMPMSDREKEKIDEFVSKFIQAMDDDFNMPLALAYAFELMDFANGFDACQKEDTFKYAQRAVKQYLEIFGLHAKEASRITESTKGQLKERDRARKNKDFQRADEIRKQLESQGIHISDTMTGCTVEKMCEDDGHEE
jgi:cysteinyl-tRNA synthetase